MEPLKPYDYKVLFELMKDSRRSDREVGRAAGISQPTVTRRRNLLEKGIIYAYTVLPKLGKCGFEFAALTFMKTKPQNKNAKDKQAATGKLRNWFDAQPCVVAASEGRGLGYNSVCVSLHASYRDYAEFARTLENDLCDQLAATEAFLIDLKAGDAAK
jgi:DNA-binding Lrp family transcriptional regulator